jgi:inorganic pyrophosphatase
MTRLRPTAFFIAIVVAATSPSRGADTCADLRPRDLPAAIEAKLGESLAAAKPHKYHVWRDVTPSNPDGTLNAYVEIARGESVKWELDIARNERRIDRKLPRSLGGYPTGYGFVPRTISYDGDPFDVLVLGPRRPGGRFVEGRIVGVMCMVDEKGPDSKVVVSPLDANGRTLYALDDAERQRIGAFFNIYKKHEAEKGKFSRVTGWGDAAEGLKFVETTAGFFSRGRARNAARQKAEGKT